MDHRTADELGTVDLPEGPVLSRAGELARWWHTVRHHRASQLARRLLSVTRAKLGLDLPSLPSGLADSLELVPDDSFRELAARKLEVRRQDADFAVRVERLQAGRIRLLDHELDLGPQIDWASPKLSETPRLWRFQFEYHEWMLDLSSHALARGDGASLDALWNLLLRWIGARPLASAVMHPDAWHPYCISRRIPAWLTFWAAAPCSGRTAGLLRESLAVQAHHLAGRLERDLGGNHLLENARALVLAGTAFRGREAGRWLRLGSDVVKRELPQQILPHGEHFERSPMYHCQMLDALADIRDVTREKAAGLSQRCDEAVRRMQEFLSEIQHPDGEIPLLGDSCFGEAPRAATVLSRRPAVAATPQRPAASARRRGSYWIWRNRDDFLLFDAGPVGADDLPAHAHADLLTIEASLDGRRLIVDSGSYDYESGAMRRYCRSTAAHNVLEVDGLNQCDVWSRFRMGRRGRPAALECGEQSGLCWARCTHNAYRTVGVPLVGRWIGCAPTGQWWIVDWAAGAGRHRLVNRLHLHPDVRVAVRNGAAELSLDDRHVSLRPLTPGRFSLKPGWYCPQFGQRVKSPVLVWEATCDLPALCGWHVSGNAICNGFELTLQSGQRGRLVWSDATGERQEFDIPLRPTA